MLTGASLRGLITLFAGEGASRALSFLAVALLARRLGDVGWAPVAVALTASQFGALFVESGMRLYGAREVARDPYAAGRIAPAVLATQAAIGLGLVLIAALAGPLGVRPELARLLPGYAVALLALPFFVPWIFQGHGAMQWVAAPQVLRYALFLVLCAVIVSGPQRVIWLPWIEAASMAGGALLAAWAVRRLGVSLSIAPSRTFEQAILREAVPIAASQLLWVVRMYLPTVLLWKLSTEVSVSRFDLSHRVLMVLQGFLTMYLTNLYTPLAREARDPGRPFARLLLGSTAVAAVGAGALAIALAVQAGPVLGILYGAPFNHPEAAMCLALLGFVFPVLAIRGHGHFALVALGRQRLEFACSLASSLLLVGLLALWVPRDAAVGAARAMLVSEAAGLVLTWLAMWSATRRAPAPGEPTAPSTA